MSVVRFTRGRSLPRLLASFTLVALLAFATVAEAQLRRPVRRVATESTRPAADLVVTHARVVCSVLVPYRGNVLRKVKGGCNPKDQVDLEVTLENRGNRDATLPSGWMWSVESDDEQIAAFARGSTRLTYIVPNQQPRPLPSQIKKIAAGKKIERTVVLVPRGKIDAGSHSLEVVVDPEGKIAERNEDNNAREVSFDVEKTGEWVSCPSVGVSTLVAPRLVGGRVLCEYYNRRRRTEKLTSRRVSSNNGKPFKSCLRGNRGYERADAATETYSSRMYCSFVKTQEQLVRSAYGWSASRNATRVKLGSRTLDGRKERFHVCRASYQGEQYLGRVWRGRCYFPHQGTERRVTSGFEYLVLTQDYGRPDVRSSRSGWSGDDWEGDAVVFNPRSSRPMGIGRIDMFPGNALGRALGLEKDVMLMLPALVLSGGRHCTATARGKPVADGNGCLLLVLR